MLSVEKKKKKSKEKEKESETNVELEGTIIVTGHLYTLPSDVKKFQIAVTLIVILLLKRKRLKLANHTLKLQTTSANHIGHQI